MKVDTTLNVYTQVLDGSARDALVRQVVSPVRWDEEVSKMADDGLTTFVEFGPGRVLAGLVRRIRKGARVLSVPDAAGLDAALAELGS